MQLNKLAICGIAATIILWKVVLTSMHGHNRELVDWISSYKCDAAISSIPINTCTLDKNSHGNGKHSKLKYSTPAKFQLTQHMEIANGSGILNYTADISTHQRTSDTPTISTSCALEKSFNISHKILLQPYMPSKILMIPASKYFHIYCFVLCNVLENCETYQWFSQFFL